MSTNETQKRQKTEEFVGGRLGLNRSRIGDYKAGPRAKSLNPYESGKLNAGAYYIRIVAMEDVGTDYYVRFGLTASPGQ